MSASPRDQSQNECFGWIPSFQGGFSNEKSHVHRSLTIALGRVKDLEEKLRLQNDLIATFGSQLIQEGKFNGNEPEKNNFSILGEHQCRHPQCIYRTSNVDTWEAHESGTVHYKLELHIIRDSLFHYPWSSMNSLNDWYIMPTENSMNHDTFPSRPLPNAASLISQPSICEPKNSSASFVSLNDHDFDQRKIRPSWKQVTHTGLEMQNVLSPQNHHVDKRQLITKEEAKFHCDKCPKSFTRGTTLRDHYRTHTNERPFKCGKCNKGFPRRKEMIRHEKLHTGEKIYVCGREIKGFGCGHGFAREDALVAHLVSLSGQTCLDDLIYDIVLEWTNGNSFASDKLYGCNPEGPFSKIDTFIGCGAKFLHLNEFQEHHSRRTPVQCFGQDTKTWVRKLVRNFLPLRRMVDTGVLDAIDLESSPRYGHSTFPMTMTAFPERNSLRSRTRETDDAFLLDLRDDNLKAPYSKQQNSEKAHTCRWPWGRLGNTSGCEEKFDDDEALADHLFSKSGLSCVHGLICATGRELVWNMEPCTTSNGRDLYVCGTICVLGIDEFLGCGKEFTNMMDMKLHLMEVQSKECFGRAGVKSAAQQLLRLKRDMKRGLQRESLFISKNASLLVQ